jgi:hypothetical protein
MPRGFPIKKMKDIQKKLQSMDDDNQKVVMHIILEDNIMYTENTNGVFFDLMTLEKESLEKILKLIEFCDSCDEYLKKRDTEQTSIQMDMNERVVENARS